MAVVDGQIQDGLSQITASEEKRLFIVGAYPPVGAVAEYPGLARFAKEMDAAATAGNKDAKIRNSSNLRAWLSVHAVAQVAKGVTGEITPSSLLAAFGTAKDVDLFGILPAWTPSAKGSVAGFERASNARVFFLRLVDGKFVAATPLKGLDLNTRKPLT